MDCLRSFSFIASANSTITTPEINTWGVAPQNYWNAQIGITTFSRYNIQGFKTINVFKIQAVGDVGTTLNTSNSVIVNDWDFVVRVNGSNNLIGNNIVSSPNPFVISNQPNNPIFALGRYNGNLNLSDPIVGVTSIDILGLKASGIGAQNIALINLQWNVNFIVHYTFDGE
jgi:hypothetical protein